MRVVVFQHLACEHPGIWREFLREDSADVVTVELDQGDAIPSLAGADALLVFGGPMNVDEHARFPWLVPETAVIRQAALGGVPVFGVCLGAQLLARSLGAPVTRNPVPEVGLLDVDLTEAGTSDPLFAGWPRRAPVVQWHSDTFALPAGATLLATSPACRNQAFRYGDRAYGLQFHPEVTADMVAEWADVPDYADAMRRLQSAPEGGPFVRVPAEADLLAHRARQLYCNFTALVASSM
jgi:GMP synthase-like glutamine amidotransferase